MVAVFLLFDGAALRVDAEEVGRGIVEIPFLSVDVAGFKCLRLLPVTHLGVGDVGDVALDVGLHLVVRLVEVEGKAGLGEEGEGERGEEEEDGFYGAHGSYGSYGVYGVYG